MVEQLSPRQLLHLEITETQICISSLQDKLNETCGMIRNATIAQFDLMLEWERKAIRYEMLLEEKQKQLYSLFDEGFKTQTEERA